MKANLLQFPHGPASEHAVWTLSKNGHLVLATVRATPLGPELRIAIDRELWWSHVYRHATPDVVTDAAEGKRLAFLDKGWVPTPGGARSGIQPPLAPRAWRRTLPEILWTLAQANRLVQARTRPSPYGIELRIVVDGQLSWSRTFLGSADIAGIAVLEAATAKRQEFLAQGWTS